MIGKEIAQAWQDWARSEQGKRCRSGSASGEYLDNRLWWAFMAGVAVNCESTNPAPATKGTDDAHSGS